MSNYRSITKSEKLALGEMTVLIGPNNEGKSNILRAIVVGMRALRELRRVAVISGGQVRLSPLARRNIDYQWERDYPISRQATNPSGDSTFSFQFLLTEAETRDFQREVGSALNGELPVELKINDNRMLFRVPKKGPGQAALSEKRAQIASFLSQRLDVEYVPAIRTADEAMRVIRQLVEDELRIAETDPEYLRALAQIEKLQRPLLRGISSTLRDTLSEFLPNVRGVTVASTREQRLATLRAGYQLIVNDGTATDIREKGDGVKSLAALSLIRHASQQRPAAAQQILAIEEPEAHLHPDAVHRLRGVLQDIADRQQVIVATHSPLFVNRLDVTKNVIVENSEARSARTRSEIRESLGVRVSDNLASADVVLVVEGECDRTALLTLLSERHVLRDAIADGTLAIDSAHGSTKLLTRLGALRDALCVPHVFIDNDQAAKQAARKALDEGLLMPRDITHVACPRRTESEFEDLVQVALYADDVRKTYGVDLESAKFAKGKRKWSDRVESAFSASAKLWDDEILKTLKKRVSELVVAHGSASLSAQDSMAIQVLGDELEQKITAARQP